jgi:hypothetical protein
MRWEQRFSVNMMNMTKALPSGRDEGRVVIKHEHSDIAASSLWYSVNMMNTARMRLPERNTASSGSVVEDPLFSIYIYPETRCSIFLRNVGIYQTARCYIPKSRRLNIHSGENLKLDVVSGILVSCCANCLQTAACIEC